MHFWYICIVFSIFNVISEEFKFFKVFWTLSTFNTLILQSLIFLIESTLVLFVFKINTKYKKKKSWGTNMIVTKPLFSYIYQSIVKKKGGENFEGWAEKNLWNKRTQKNPKRPKLSSLSNQAAAHSPLLLPECNSLSLPPHRSSIFFSSFNQQHRASPL